MSALLALCLACAAQPDAQRFPALHLTVASPPLEDLAFDAQVEGQVQGAWSGKLGALAVDVVVSALPAAEFGFVEAEDVSELVRSNLSEREEWSLAEWDAREPLTGAFGASPIAALTRGGLRAKGEVAATLITLSGITSDHGYTLEVYVEPAADEAAIAKLTGWLRTAVAYDGPKREARWTDAEARARWDAVAPESAQKKLEAPLRTEHYLILTDSSGGKAFAKKMEEAYAAVRKTYPFPELAGRRLMPVFLFRTPDEYYAFSQKASKMSLEEAQATKGHAYKDFYATWYEAPNDPVHIHEATHQIFSNRLFLSGGGSWFQEGVAEYVSTKPNDRNMAARAVKKGRHVPLAEFVRLDALIAGRGGEDKSGDDEASSNYEEAALLVEFLRESKWSAPKFQELVRALGLVPDNDVAAIERVLQRVLGTDLDGLETRWVEYCKKR